MALSVRGCWGSCPWALPCPGTQHRPKAVEALALKLRALGLSMGKVGELSSSPAQGLPRDRSLPSKEQKCRRKDAGLSAYLC